MSRAKLLLRLSAVFLPILYLVFLIADRNGVWTHMRGLDKVETVAARFDESYASGASAPVSVGDTEWKPLISLIYEYSTAAFPKDKQPQTVARHRATLSTAQQDPNGELISEWTAPSTPILVLYRKWPGQQVPKEDWVIAGTIGDLHSWIIRSKDDFRFKVKDVLFVLFSFAVGFSLVLHDHRSAKGTQTGGPVERSTPPPDQDENGSRC